MAWRVLWFVAAVISRDALAGCARRAAEDGRFLLVVALGDERRSEPERLGAFDLSDDVPCALRLAGEQIAGQLLEYLHRWSGAHGASRVGRAATAER